MRSGFLPINYYRKGALISMIIGNISDCVKYFSVNNVFKDAFETLKNIKYGENDTQLTVNFSELNTSDFDADGTPKPFEAHRKYIDLHYIFEGSEDFGYANIMYLGPVTKYNEKNDYLLLKGEISRITLYAGDFAIVFPEDAHISAMSNKDTKTVKRAVVKIPV